MVVACLQTAIFLTLLIIFVTGCSEDGTKNLNKSTNIVNNDDSNTLGNATTITGGFKGDIVQQGQCTFVVSVRQDGRHVNVGVIVRSEYVLTEAWHFGNCSSVSCGVSVRSGTVNAAEGGTIRTAVQVISHENYTHPHFAIALIKIAPPFTEEEICKLPSEEQIFEPGTEVKTFAWGGFSVDVLTTLLMDTLTILNEDQCSKLENWFPEEQICTRSLRTGSGLCDGDYGAPLIVHDSTVVGINIYNTCGGALAPPDRFFNIVPLLPWIQKYIKKI